MKRYVLVACGALMAATSALSAQGGGLTTSPCPPGSSTLGVPNATRVAQDACNQAYDVYQFIGPQLGLALAGGNATLGQGGVMGGFGHFSVGIRGNVFNGRVPQVDQFHTSVNGAQQQTLPTTSQVLAMPTADAAIGIFKGIPLAIANVGGIDALVSAEYVPTITTHGVSITPQNNWQFGYGVRVGLLSESIITPGVSVTWIERDLPTTDIVGAFNSGSSVDSLKVLNTKVKTSAWRVVASKSLILFGFAVGAGQDHYKQSADISASASQPPFSGSASPGNTSQDLTRTNVFADVSFNMPLFKLVGEIGQVSGGTVQTYNSFSGGRADRSQVYGSAGIRLSW